MLYFCTMEIIIDSIENIAQAAGQFAQAIGERRVFAFHGKMGAGKTTFVKALCEHLGVEDVVNSPTFAIVNEYEDGEGQPIYHFDFYRLKRLSEAYDMGCEEYFYSGHLCLIEWPDIVADILPEDTVDVTIEEQADGTRCVRFKD